MTARAGFRINSLVSPHYNARWSALVAEFLQAKRSPETLQTFTNLVLGQSWRTEGDELDEHELFGRREEGVTLESLPEDVLWLTVGVDCGDNALHVVIVGHTESGGAIVLDHRVIHGRIDGDDVWQDLDSLTRETWRHPLGGRVGISAVAVDSGDGGHTPIVHSWTRARFGRRCVSIKGVPGAKVPLFEKSKSQQLWIVGADTAKSIIYMRITRGEGLRFGGDLSAVFFDELTSERRIVRYKAGQPIAAWERIKGKRAEGLDATAYGLAVRGLIQQSAEHRLAELSTLAAPKRAPAVIRSKWLEGRQAQPAT